MKNRPEGVETSLSRGGFVGRYEIMGDVAVPRNRVGLSAGAYERYADATDYQNGNDLD